MPDIWMDVDTALSEVPVNIMPLVDDTDFKAIEAAIAYNAAGMALIWHFVTTAGVQTETAVTPTTAGVHDWTDQGASGCYALEIPDTGGTINNDTEGFGWFTGVVTGVLPWRGPIIGFRDAALNNLMIDDAMSVTRGLTGTALPAAAANAAGGIPISAAGALALDTQLAATNEITAARMGALTDWIDGNRLDSLVDTLLTRLSAARATLLDNIPAGIMPTQAEVLSIQNNTRTQTSVPTVAERPDAGATRLKIYLNNFDTVGNMEAPDSAPTVTVINEEGTTRSGNLQHPTTHVPGTTMINLSTGRYWIEYDLDNADALENLIFSFTVVEGGATRTFDRQMLVVDTTAVDFTAADRAKLDTLHDTRIPGVVQPQTGDGFARMGAPVGADLSTDIAAIPLTAMRGTDGANTTVPDAAGTAATLHGVTNGLITTVDTVVDAIALLFTGITSIAEWLGLIAGKQVGDVTALSEMQATGAGSGTYDPTTDSPEAIRDRGDVAWAGGGDATEAKQDTILANQSAMAGAGFLEATDSQEAIRNRGDAAWIGAADSAVVLQNTTIDVLTSQTVFTLVTASPDDAPDPYTDHTVIITDQTTGEQKASGVVASYVAATQQLTLLYDPGVFDFVAGDTIDILADKSKLLSELENGQQYINKAVVPWRLEIYKKDSGVPPAGTLLRQWDLFDTDGNSLVSENSIPGRMLD